MNISQSNIISLLVALCIHFADSQDCLMHKVQVQIVCKSVSREEMLDDDSLTCLSAKSTNVTSLGSTVSSVLHSNGSEVTNLAEIETFACVDSIMKFIPTGISTKFPNLRVLVVNNCKLVSVSKKNLREFGDLLEFIALPNNKITSIDADLFEYNPNIKNAIFQANPIKFIDPEFFTNLKSLKTVERIYFDDAGCMDQTFDTGEGHDIATFEWDNENCTDTTATFETQKLIEESLCEDTETSNLTTKIEEHEEEKAENALMLASKLDLIVNSIHFLSETLNTRISALEEMLKNLREDLKLEKNSSILS